MQKGDGDLALVAVPLSTREDFTLFTTRASRGINSEQQLINERRLLDQPQYQSKVRVTAR